MTPLQQYQEDTLKKFECADFPMTLSGKRSDIRIKSFNKASMCRLLERVKGNVEGIKLINFTTNGQAGQMEKEIMYRVNKSLEEVTDILNSYITEMK
jgi:hypothetical protein